MRRRDWLGAGYKGMRHPQGRVPKARGSVADRGAVRPPARFATLAAVTLAVAMFGGCGPASRTPAGRPASSGAAGESYRMR